MRNDVEVSLKAALKNVPVEMRDVATQAIINFLKHYNDTNDSSIVYITPVIWDLVDIMSEKEE